MVASSSFAPVVRTAARIIKKESYTDLQDILARCQVLVEHFPPDRYDDGRSASGVLISDYRRFFGRESRNCRELSFSQLGSNDQIESQPTCTGPAIWHCESNDMLDLIKSKLSVKDWGVFEMRFLGEKTPEEIGQILRKSKSTIYRQLKVILKVVKTALEEANND